MSALRQFLYISPYFPPQSRVGALRPLKFARHLPAWGWSPVVLCDLWPSADVNPELNAAIPDSTVIIRDYSARARRAEAALTTPPRPADAAQARPRRRGKLAAWASGALTLPRWLDNPELIPLGEHSVHMPHALKAARRALSAQPRCEAIVVNADPYAALLVGAKLARETGLPLIQDLRDPWAVCELRRPRRPTPILQIVDRLERAAFDPAARIILNTETTLRDTLAHYPDMPPSRFACIRNHGDAGLIGAGHHPGFDRFTLLFLGNFRRFVEGDILLDLLAALQRRGLDHRDLQLVITGAFPQETRALARLKGVEAMLSDHPFVPYSEIGAVMSAADLLVALSNRTTQRIPAKFYDYALTGRPILALADNPEFGDLVSQSGGAIFGLDEPEAAAAHVHALITRGRAQIIERRPLGLSSEEASGALAAILDEVTRRR